MKILRLSLFVLALAMLMPACFKIKQAVTVMPDGSGKMEVTMAYNKKQLDAAFESMPMGRAPRQADPTDVDLETLESLYQGFVAFTKVKEWTTEDGWKYVKYSGYFEDVNKVKIHHTENREGAKPVRMSFTFKPLKEGGFELTCVDSINPNAQMAARADRIPPEMEDMIMPTVEAAMKGLELERIFLVPGEVMKADDCTSKKGRVASSLIASKDMKSLDDFRKLGAKKSFRITCGKSVVTDVEAAAFRSELDDAIDAWKEMKKKAKAAAEKKAKEEAEAEKEEAGKEK